MPVLPDQPGPLRLGKNLPRCATDGLLAYVLPDGNQSAWCTRTIDRWRSNTAEFSTHNIGRDPMASVMRPACSRAQSPTTFWGARSFVPATADLMIQARMRSTVFWSNPIGKFSVWGGPRADAG